jgi:hypothetical protein
MIGKTRVLQSYRQEDALSILFESHFRLLGSFYLGGIGPFHAWDGCVLMVVNMRTIPSPFAFVCVCELFMLGSAIILLMNRVNASFDPCLLRSHAHESDC